MISCENIFRLVDYVFNINRLMKLMSNGMTMCAAGGGVGEPEREAARGPGGGGGQHGRDERHAGRALHAAARRAPPRRHRPAQRNTHSYTGQFGLVVGILASYARGRGFDSRTVQTLCA
jgi:hypothetical protein